MVPLSLARNRVLRASAHPMREGARGINDYLSLMAAQGSSAMKQMISNEKRAQIIAALKDNPNAAQIAREVGGVGYRTVVRLAEGAGVELTAGKAVGGRPRFSAEKRALIIAALKDNPNATQIAQEIGGVSHTTVGKIAKAAGIALAAAEYGKRLSAEKRTQIVDALKANPNAAEVAKQIGGVTKSLEDCESCGHRAYRRQSREKSRHWAPSQTARRCRRSYFGTSARKIGCFE